MLKTQQRVFLGSFEKVRDIWEFGNFLNKRERGIKVFQDSEK